MTAGRRLPSWSRALAAVVVPAAAGLGVAGCTEVEEAASHGYEPARLAPIEGTDLKRVTFTEEGARRVGLRTATVQRRGGRTFVPYRALIYDGQGRAYVYTGSGHLTFVRRHVDVARIEGARVLLSRGPPAGTRLVTVGATEVYGAELEIEGGH